MCVGIHFLQCDDIVFTGIVVSKCIKVSTDTLDWMGRE